MHNTPHINTDKLRKWLDSRKGTFREAKSGLAESCGVSLDTINRTLRGKKPTTPTQKLIALATGMKQDVLFPTKKGKAA